MSTPTRSASRNPEETPEKTTPRLTDLTDLTPLSATTGDDAAAVYADLRKRYGAVAPVELEPGLPAWLVMDYLDVCEVVSNETVFSRNGDAWHLQKQVPPTSGLLPWITPRENSFSHDGEKRRRLRAPIDQGFRELDEPTFVRRVRRSCLELIDDFRDQGEADLMRDYVAWVPLLAFATLFGLEEERARELAVATLTMVSTRPEAAQGLRDMHALITAHVELRRRQPAGDLTTSFVQHPNFEGNDSLAVNALSMIIGGGYEMTAGLLSQSLLVTLAGGQGAASRNAGGYEIDQTIDQVLWREPPVRNLPLRFAVCDVELGGRTIHKGDAVVGSVVTAHADPTATGEEDPWMEVGNHAHLAFSIGPHACPAQRAGQLIVRTAVLTALGALPGVRLDVPVDEVPRIAASLWTRYPISLPVRFEPAPNLG